MGAKSLIAKQIDADTFRTVVCMAEGFLEYQGPLLLNFYNTPELVDQILDLGDICVLKPNLYPDPNFPHDILRPQYNVTLSYIRDLSYGECCSKILTSKGMNSMARLVDYVYVFDLTGTWKYAMSSNYSKGLRDIKMYLDVLEKGIGILGPSQGVIIDEQLYEDLDEA